MKRDTVKQHYWIQQIDHWQASDLAQRAFCEREGLKFGTFDYWRRALQSEAETAKLPPPKTKNADLTLVPVHVNTPAAVPDLLQRSPQGWELRLLLDVQARWLGDLLQQLA
jgi:hypothetical protein